MSRRFTINDAGGRRHTGTDQLPLSIGEGPTHTIQVDGIGSDDAVAYIAESEGYLYLQAAGGADVVFHNHKQLTGSAWLKSGDRIEAGNTIITWRAEGDQVSIDAVDARSAAGAAAQAAPVPHGPRPSRPPSAAPPREPEATAADLPPTFTPGSRRTPRSKAVIAIGALLLTAVGFVVLATPIGLRIEPEPESLSLRGFPPPIRAWGRYLCLPGRYTVNAVREGYHPLRERVSVAFFKAEEFSFRLKEIPGRITLELTPETAYTLLVDSNKAEPNQDGTFAINSGRRSLTARTERYLPETIEAEILGFGRAQSIRMQLRPGWADVAISSKPAGAEIRVDGAIAGVTPDTIEILRGSPEIVLSLALHKPVTLRPEVKAGEAMTLDEIAFEPADGILEITSTPEGALVTIDGGFYGTTPVAQPLGSRQEHVIRIAKPGYQTREKKVTLEPEETRPLTFELAASFGTVFLSSEPADAKLRIDGKEMGRATQRLRLPTRAHTFEIRRTGYETERLTVTPDIAAAKSLNVTLLSTQAAQRAKTPQTLTTSSGQVMLLLRPSGTFTMGSTRREQGHRANESTRLVSLSYPYYLGAKEVTNAEFRKFNSAHRTVPADGAPLDGGTQPVAGVTWQDAARYCNWLSNEEGLEPAYLVSSTAVTAVTGRPNGYRLPTEAEWAYAARFYRRSEPARYPWTGSYPPTTPVGNFADAQIANRLADVVPGYDDGYRGSAPVGSFSADAGGFYDMGGNVAEWTQDFYAVYPGEESKLVTDPRGPATGDHHVIRGSGWRHGSITELRLSFRDYSRESRPDVGFRIARDAK